MQGKQNLIQLTGAGKNDENLLGGGYSPTEVSSEEEYQPSMKSRLRLDLGKVVIPSTKNQNAREVTDTSLEFSPSEFKHSAKKYFGHVRTPTPRPSGSEEGFDQRLDKQKAVVPPLFKLDSWNNVVRVSTERMPESYVRKMVEKKFSTLKTLIKFYDLFTFMFLLCSVLVWIFAKEHNFSLLFFLLFLDGVLISGYYWYYISPNEGSDNNEIIMDKEKAEKLEQIVMIQSFVSVITLFILLARGILYFILQLLGRANHHHPLRPWMRHSKKFMIHLFVSMIFGLVLHFFSFVALEKIGRMSAYWRRNLEKLSTQDNSLL